MYVHLSEAALHDSSVDPVARLERDDGLVWVGQVGAWCGRPDTQVIVKPVIDLDACKESTPDQVPEPIKEKVALRDRTCVFPWCTRPARNCHPGDPDRHPGDPDRHLCDSDHIIPRGRNGPTCSCNVAPLCRRQPRPRSTLWFAASTRDLITLPAPGYPGRAEGLPGSGRLVRDPAVTPSRRPRPHR